MTALVLVLVLAAVVAVAAVLLRLVLRGGQVGGLANGFRETRPESLERKRGTECRGRRWGCTATCCGCTA